MARVFVGILLPENLKNPVVGVQKMLEKLPIECKFVEEENLHISLDFIGEVETDEIERIRKKITGLAKTITEFTVEIGELKLIPNERHVRVIALDIHSPELSSLGQMLRDAIGGDAKPSHLTLCRVKKVLSRNDLAEKFDQMKHEKIGSFRISSIQLIKSELRREGPAYSMVSDFPLG